jgi:hypothetical protein
MGDLVDDLRTWALAHFAQHKVLLSVVVTTLEQNTMLMSYLESTLEFTKGMQGRPGPFPHGPVLHTHDAFFTEGPDAAEYLNSMREGLATPGVGYYFQYPPFDPAKAGVHRVLFDLEEKTISLRRGGVAMTAMLRSDPETGMLIGKCGNALLSLSWRKVDYVAVHVPKDWSA